MIRYVPTSSAAFGPLTQALWELSRPESVRAADEVTDEMFGSVTMSDGSVWLEVDTDLDIPVHPDAILDGIADVMLPWIERGQLPANTNTELAAFVQSRRGLRMNPYEDGFPPLFKSLSKTREELESLGLWPAR